MDKGVSPVIAVVLLIVVAVIGGTAVYFFAAGLATTKPGTPEPAPLSISPIGGGKILVANLGQDVFNTSGLETTETDVLVECLLELLPANEQTQCTLVGRNPPLDRDVVVYGPGGGSAMVNPLASGYRDPNCGDGLLHPNPPDNEECDDGNTEAQDACTNFCLNATCGDFIVWTINCGGLCEECDDGEDGDNHDSCVVNCTDATCGDGYIWNTDGGNEECDNGTALNNDTVPDACRTNCKNPWCGDNVIDTGEECDDGGANSDVNPDACRTDCKNPWCGDGVTDSGEGCDDGNSCNGDGCYNCQVEDWVETYGTGSLESIRAVIDAGGGNITFAGKSNDNYWIVKLNSTGSEIWGQTLDRDSAADDAYDVVKAASGHYVVTGSSTKSGSPGAWTVMRNYTDGTAVWANEYEGGSTTRGYALFKASDGHIIVSGVTNGATERVLALKINKTDGTQLWANNFNVSGDAIGAGIAEHSDGNYVFAGEAQTTDDAFVVKVNSSDGSRLAGWGGTFDYNIRQDIFHDIISTGDGHFLAVGEADTGTATGVDVWAVKINSTDGSAIWNYTFDSGGNSYDKAYKVVEHSAGGFVMAGWANNGVDYDGWVLKIDAAGSEVWNYTYGCTGNYVLSYVDEMSTGGFVAGGYMPDNSNDGWILRLDANGLL